MRTARPILMSAPMVRSTLEGIKTQTRRLVKPQPDMFETAPGVPCEVRAWHDENGVRIWKGSGWRGQGTGTGVITNQRCPFGKPGDLAWVRETFLPDPPADHSSWEDEGIATYVSWSGCGGALGDIPQALRTPSHVLYRATWKTEHKWQWRPAIHMPRWASRLTLEITDVRVERLQDMEGQHPSESDAIAEGVNKIHHGDGAYYYSAFRNEPHPKNWCDPTDAYRELWEKLNGKGSWDANPWVWVLTFKVHHANVDAVLAQRAEVAA